MKLYSDPVRDDYESEWLGFSSRDDDDKVSGDTGDAGDVGAILEVKQAVAVPVQSVARLAARLGYAQPWGRYL